MNHGYFQRELPAPLSDLEDLALDLRWNNCPAARNLWRRLAPEIWARTENPFLVLQAAHEERIASAVGDELLLAELKEWRREVEQYYRTPPEFRTLDPHHTLQRVAYFSMEFGLSEALPIYSGGLGMLAGDHLKTASDVGVPLIGIGLLYQQGYFRQVIGEKGEQIEAYPFNDPGSLPVRPVTDSDGHWVRVRLPLPGRTLYLRVWKAQVGRVPLFLLDSNDAMNKAWDRGITAQLYDAGQDKRLLQELVLGVGGWRLIERLEPEVDVCHLNEGHAAFAVLARAAGFSRSKGVSLRVALTVTRAGNVFTTHTPVEAAFDCFDAHQLTHYAQPFVDEVGLPIERVLRLGRRDFEDRSEPFNMAWLAMRGCCHVNGVSQLHGAVSRKLFGELFPRRPPNEVPIRAITNGVHVPTWASRRAAELWGDETAGHLWKNGLERVTDRIDALSSEDLWSFRTEQRQGLVDYVIERCRQQAQTADPDCGRSDAPTRLDPNVLTIGFARRFSSYKRANLLLSHPDRLKRLLLDHHRPVQLLVAGKAHPNDEHGKALVQQMTRFIRQPDLCGRAVFLEDYDMVLGQHLVAGVDVWLNTPVRPNEACGTSGMKVLVNGGLNLSVLDGWWDEAVDFDEPNETRPGWIVGTRDGGSFEELCRRDAASLFDLLEHQVVPEFYERDEDGIPHRWVDRIRASLSRLTPQFSATRMVHQYVSECYLPAAAAYSERAEDKARLAGKLLDWNEAVSDHWDRLRIGQVRGSVEGDRWQMSVECWLDDLPRDGTRVELYADGGESPVVVPLERTGALPGSVHGYLFSGSVPADRPLSDYTVRVVPHHPGAFVPIENPCILWDH